MRKIILDGSFQNIQRISRMLGVGFDGLEEQAMMLFKEIEKRKKEKVRGEKIRKNPGIKIDNGWRNLEI